MAGGADAWLRRAANVGNGASAMGVVDSSTLQSHQLRQQVLEPKRSGRLFTREQHKVLPLNLKKKTMKG